MKIQKKKINSMAIVLSFVLMEQCFYLIDTSLFRFVFVNYAMFWYFIFLGMILWLGAKYKLYEKRISMYFSSDVWAFIILGIIATVQSLILINQPMSMGFAPQRSYLTILFSYFIIRKLIALGKIDIGSIEKGIIITGLISVSIYLLQIIVFDSVRFIHVYSSIKMKRLYVDSFLCVVIGFLGFDKFLSTNKKKYLLLTAGTILYELMISKGRLEFTSFVLGLTLMILIMKRGSLRKTIIIIFVSLAIMVFINSSFFDRFQDAILLQLTNSSSGVDTMAIRTVARTEFLRQLKQNFMTMVFGCGYPNIEFSATLSTAYQSVGNERTGLVDNGVFAFAYVYGLLGIAILVKWFWKLYKCAIKMYKNCNVYWPLGFVVFLTILSYNVTFWWHKPSWTLGMVFFMCYMENKLNDCVTENK